MQNHSKGSAAVPDSHSSLSGGGIAVMQEMMEMKMLEAQVLQGYNPPGLARKGPEVEWIRNTLDGSILHDHKGYPVSVNRLLATKPLRTELSSRPGPGGKKLTYLSGEGVTRTLNEVFGFDGWDMSIVKTQREECVRDDKGRFHVAYTAQVRLTHKRSGTYKEDVGASDSIDRIMGTAVAHALKGSITDALKRAARHFGEKLGNTLYQGDFSINKAPLTLQDALDQYDNDRATTKFGPSTTKPPPSSMGELPSIARQDSENVPTPKGALAKQNTSMGRVVGAAPSNKSVSIAKESISNYQSSRSNIDTQQQTAGRSSMQSSMATVAKTPSASTAPRPIVSATPSANKFRNISENQEPTSNPPKFQLPTTRQSFSSNNAPLPPPSAAERLRSQSSMFNGGSFGAKFGNPEKENAMQNGVCQGNGMLVRPATSQGRRSDPGVVEWSRQQSGGLKRPANMTGPPMMNGNQGSNKRMNSNPYTQK